MIGYKVMYRSSLGHGDTFISTHQAFIYQLNVKKFRPADWGPMVLFKRLYEALDYAILNPEHQCVIVKCEYEKSKDRKIWDKFGNTRDILNGNFDYGLFRNAIRKTCFADTVTPLKIVFTIYLDLDPARVKYNRLTHTEKHKVYSRIIPIVS